MANCRLLLNDGSPLLLNDGSFLVLNDNSCSDDDEGGGGIEEAMRGMAPKLRKEQDARDKAAYRASLPAAERLAFEWLDDL